MTQFGSYISMSLPTRKGFKMKQQKGYTLVKLQYLTLEYFQYQGKGLIDYSTLTGRQRHQVFIQKSSNVWCDRKSLMMSIKDKDEQYEITGNSIMLFDVIRTKIGDKAYFYISNLMPNVNIFINAPNLHLTTQNTLPVDQRGLQIKGQSEIIMGNIKMIIVQLQESIKVKESLGNEQINEKEYRGKDEVCYFCSKKEKLVYICQCYGHVHLECFVRSEERKMMMDNRQESRGVYKLNLMCKRCKDQYGYQIQQMKTIKRLIFYMHFQEPITHSSLMLVQICRIEPIKPEHKQQRQFILLQFQPEEDISIGRQSNNHISIDQLSVSRKHAKISYSNPLKKYEIFNLNAKFGTLLRWKGQKVPINRPTMLNYNRNIIQISKNEKVA